MDSWHHLDLDLERAGGGRRTLRSYCGRPAVLFWERRERLEDNAPLKSALTDLARTLSFTLIAVGDVSDLDVGPARPIVRAATAAIARAHGLELLLDWKADLGRAPFHLVPGHSNVLVLDAGGRPVLRASGVLDARARAQVLAALRAMATPAHAARAPRDEPPAGQALRRA